MKESAGRANPAALNEILMRKLNQAWAERRKWRVSSQRKVVCSRTAIYLRNVTGINPSNSDLMAMRSSLDALRQAKLSGTLWTVSAASSIAPLLLPVTGAMATEDEAAVAGIATPSKPDKEEEKATEQTVADAVADVDAPAPQELREEQIENAIAFLAHPKVARPLT